MTGIQTIVVEPGTPELAICARWRVTAFSVQASVFTDYPGGGRKQPVHPINGPTRPVC